MKSSLNEMVEFIDFHFIIPNNIMHFLWYSISWKLFITPAKPINSFNISIVADRNHRKEIYIILYPIEKGLDGFYVQKIPLKTIKNHVGIHGIARKCSRGFTGLENRLSLGLSIFFPLHARSEYHYVHVHLTDIK